MGSGERPPRRFGPFAWIVAVLAVVATWPFRRQLHVWPIDDDAMQWMARGSEGNDWVWTYVFSKPHFIAYRPVAALSYWANSLVGVEPWVYRGTDLVLHGLVVAAVAWFARVLADEEGRVSVVALLAAALFALHPVQEEIVPFLARRSYSLSMVFGLAALGVFVRAGRRGDGLSAQGALGAALLLAALGSNEIAFVMVPIACLLGLHAAWSRLGWRDLWRPCVLPVGVAVGMWFRRIAVLGDTGGYHKPYFASVRAGRKMIQRRGAEPTLAEVYDAAWTYLTTPVSLAGEDPWVPWGPLVHGALAVAAGVALIGWAWHRREDPRARVGAVFVVWLGGALTMCALSHVWFFRMGYAVALPYALGVAWLAGEALRASDRPPWARGAVLVLAGILAVPWAARTPVLQRDAVAPAGMVRATSDVIHQARPAVEAAKKGGGPIYLALPLPRPQAVIATRWFERFHPRRRVQLAIHVDDLGGPGIGRVETRDGRPWYLPSGGDEPDKGLLEHVVDGELPLDAVAGKAEQAWFVYPEGFGWDVVALHGGAGARDVTFEEAEIGDTDP